MEDATRLSKPERRKAPLLIDYPPNTDPLKLYTRDGQPCGHCIRDLWRPSAAFYVGSGPSLNCFDLERLKNRGIISLGINNAAGFAPVSAFVCGDPPEKFHHGIWLDPNIAKFIPRSKLQKRVRAKVDGQFQWTSYQVRHCPSTWAFDRRCHWDPDTFFSDEMATWGVNDAEHRRTGRPKCIFTFFIGLRLLHYLGVRRVYLIGVDFAMDVTDSRKVGNYAFPQAGHGAGNNEHYRAAVDLMAELAPVFERNNYQVFNVNPESRLSLFPYVPFEVAVEDCRGAVPAEPFDLSNWYEKGSNDEG